jgi:hypothetical protein
MSRLRILLALVLLHAGCLASSLPGANPAPGAAAIAFAVRRQNYDGHWYANFGYYADRRAQLSSGRALSEAPDHQA